MAISLFRPVEIMLQNGAIPQQEDNTLRHFPAVAQGDEVFGD
jgi:hypothetical protein